MMQRGQALVEFVVIIPALLLLMISAHWLLSLQHQKSTLQTQAANTAWLLSRLASTDANQQSITQRFYALKANSVGLSLSSLGLKTLDPTELIAPRLSRELDLKNEGLMQKASYSTLASSLEVKALKLQQSHVVLAGAGHAVSPQWVRRRIENSAVLWASAQRNSRYLGEHITRYSAPVDSAWRRPTPSFDWLKRWEKSVPTRYQAGVK